MSTSAPTHIARVHSVDERLASDVHELDAAGSQVVGRLGHVGERVASAAGHVGRQPGEVWIHPAVVAGGEDTAEHGDADGAAHLTGGVVDRRHDPLLVAGE